jgi:Ca2+-binding RTX toxin-like protein
MQTIAEDIINAIMNDNALKAELAGAANEEAYVSCIVRVGATLGKTVTPEAVRSYLTNNLTEEELSDMALEAVVGGKAGNGDDLLRGTAGNDTMFGYGGNDTLQGIAGDDSMDGGTGDDSMSGGDGNDTMYGGEGNDTMDGAWNNDTMYGGEGNDSMDGGGNGDFLDGGEGDDTMDGGSGLDTMYGGEGNDSMDGGGSYDFLDGGEGDDTLDGGRGKYGDDTLTGGHGADVFVFGADDSSDTIADFNKEEGDRIQLIGVTSIDELDVSHTPISTIISYGETTITVERAHLTAEEIMDMQSE